MRLMPRTRGGVLWRAAVAAVVVIAAAAGTTAVGGLLQVHQIAVALNQTKAIKGLQQAMPPDGAPETLLLIGSDHRFGEAKTAVNTDTMMLVRIDDKSATINTLSIPRDLEIHLPNGAISKINATYTDGGAPLLIKTIQQQVFPGLHVDHTIIITFEGFSRLIDAIGCVYTMVDHRYYNNTAQTGWSSIDIQPGYQKLCGHNAGPKGALAFVRFRHTDSDLVRQARQQDFLRWAKDGFSTNDLINNSAHLEKVFGKNVQTDQNLHSTHGILELADLLINANGHTMKSIPFKITGEPIIDGEDFVTSDLATTKHLYKEFITPTPLTKPKAKPKHHRKGHKHHGFTIPPGMSADTGDGHSQSAELHMHNRQLPVYYPKYIPSDAQYCFTMTGNCNLYPNPPSEYDNSYPRNYEIKDRAGQLRRSYAMTLVVNPALGDYITVEGTTWTTPPILTNPTSVKKVNGKTLDIYANGGKDSLVAWHHGKAVYWIANSLEDAVPNNQMVAMAASFTRGS